MFGNQDKSPFGNSCLLDHLKSNVKSHPKVVHDLSMTNSISPPVPDQPGYRKSLLQLYAGGIQNMR